MLTPLASHLLFPYAIRAEVHNPSSVAGEQLVTLSLLHPRTEGAHHVPNIITPSHSFCLSSSLPLLLPRTVSPLCFSLPLGRVSHFLPCAKDNVHSSTPITFQPIPGSLYLISGYMALPPSSGSISSVPVWYHLSSIPFIIYTHNSWIKAKQKPQIPNSCHEQQDK